MMKLKENISLEAVPTAFLISENSILSTSISNGILEKYDLRKFENISKIQISHEPIVGMVSLDQNTMILADKMGIIKEIDQRKNNVILRTSNINNEIHAIGIIKPGCLLIGTQKNFQVFFFMEYGIDFGFI